MGLKFMLAFFSALVSIIFVVVRSTLASDAHVYTHDQAIVRASYDSTYPNRCGHAFCAHTGSENLAFPLLDTAVKRDAYARGDCTVQNKTYDVMLISPGGTGSTSGFEYFRRNFGLDETRMNMDNDADGLKHLSFDSLSNKLFGCDLRFKLLVYQFGDPVRAVMSLYRRDYAKYHFRKLQPSFSEKHCTQDVQTNLSTYVHQKEDLLGMREHFQSYLTASLIHPMVFLRSSARERSDVKAKLQAILEYYGVIQDSRHYTGEDNTNYSPESDELAKSEFEALSVTYAPFSLTLERFGNISLVYGGHVYAW